MIIGLGLSLEYGSGGSRQAFSITITGLTDNSYALIGDHANIGFTTNPVIASKTWKWSASSDPDAVATFGSAAAPLDYTSADGFRLYLHVTDTVEGDVVTKSAPVQKLKATAGAAIDPISIVELAAMTPVDLAQNYTANGNTLTYTVAPALPSALECSTAGSLSGTPGAGAVASATYTLTATDLYSRETQSEFDLSIFEVAPTAFSDSDWSIAVIVPPSTGIGVMAVGSTFTIG